MSEISYNSVFDGISLALHNAYPDREVRASEVNQGLNRGDFTVALVSAGHSKQVGRRYLRSPVFDVIYYPKAEGVMRSAECIGIADFVTLLLGNITTPEGDVIHGTVLDWTITDGVLHVPVRYDHHIYIPQDVETMETLTIQQEG